MPDLLSPPTPKAPGKPRKAKALDRDLKPARRRVKPKPAPVAAHVAYVSAFAVGDRIAHPQFGDGTVTEIDDAKLTIAFVDRGTKQIIDSFVERHKSG
jgi:hypothetical protein